MWKGYTNVDILMWMVTVKDQLQTDRVLLRTSAASLNTRAEFAEQYIYSSATAYADEKGLLNVERIY